MSDSSDRRPRKIRQRRLAYEDYLRLDRILTAQAPLSDSPDEMLFIVIHQATELWLKLMHHEVRNAIAAIDDDDLQPAYKMLARVSRVQAQIIQSWDILSTLTPSDYLAFRSLLGEASGFQSWQYRRLEFALGDRDAAYRSAFHNDRAVLAQFDEELARPSLYDAALGLLSRSGFDLPESVTARDFSQPYHEHPAVLDAWLAVYRDTERWWDLYQLAEKLVDLEDWFQQWRFRHMKTVERIIGYKRGTGGTAGVGYLVKALERRFFPELWRLRTEL